MRAAVANGGVPGIETEAREITRRQVQVWFEWMDRILDIHRSNFVFRKASPAQLEQHKSGLKLAIRFSHWLHALIADPDFNEPELVSRLKVRARQLQDAYDTFHDPELSDEKADQILREVFPE